MLSDELTEKLKSYLDKYGYKYDFYLEDKYNARTLTDNYSSFLLKSITGLLNNSIVEADTKNQKNTSISTSVMLKPRLILRLKRV